MMMPANFTAVAENEMTYVVGGADLTKYLAPMMTEQNWQNVSTNLINLVGNSYINRFLGIGLAHVFGGHYLPGDITTGAFQGLKTIWKGNMQIGETEGWGLARAMTNVGLQVVGALSAVYTLGDSKIGLKLAANDFADKLF